MARGTRLAVLAVFTLAGCVTPATGADSYRDKARMSAEAATSEVATAEITLRAVLHHRLPKPYADRTVTAAEDALGSIGAAFGSVQPPSGQDALRDQISTLLSDADDAVAAARIAVRRADPRQIGQALGELDTVSARLGRAQERLG